MEGHINRLKMLKRQMFGRARLDLLSRRFLLAPRCRVRRTPYVSKPSGTPAELLAASPEIQAEPVNMVSDRPEGY